MFAVAKGVVAACAALVICVTTFVSLASAETDHGALCDELGAYEYDPHRMAPAVPDENIDVAALITACGKAIENGDGSRSVELERYRTQFLRGLFLLGDRAKVIQYQKSNKLDQSYPGQLHLFGAYYRSRGTAFHDIRAAKAFYRCSRVASAHIDCSFMAGKLLLETYGDPSITNKPSIEMFEDLLLGAARKEYRESDLYLAAVYLFLDFDNYYERLFSRIQFIVETITKYIYEEESKNPDLRSIAYALSALYTIRTLPNEDHTQLVDELLAKSAEQPNVIANLIQAKISKLRER